MMFKNKKFSDMICPKCGDDLSSATKVCPRCGYVVDDRIDEYLYSLDKNLKELKLLPPVSFGTYFSRNSYLLYGIMTIVFLVVMFMTDAGLFLILSLLSAVMLVVSVVRKLSLKNRNSEADSRFREIMTEIESCIRILKADYGESMKVRDQIRSTISELKDVRYAYEANRRNSVKVWIALLVVTVGLSVVGITLLGMRDLDNKPESSQTSDQMVSFNG